MALDEIQIRRRIRLAAFFGLEDDVEHWEAYLAELEEGENNE